MKVQAIVLFVFSLFFGYSAKAQLGFAVAKSCSGSSLDYAVTVNEGYQSEYLAKQNLKQMGFQRVYNLNGGDERGHNLQEGFYVVIKAERRNYLGKKIVSYGLGASSSSPHEAKERALSNLKQYDWAWKEIHGFEVIEEERF